MSPLSPSCLALKNHHRSPLLFRLCSELPLLSFFFHTGKGKKTRVCPKPRSCIRFGSVDKLLLNIHLEQGWLLSCLSLFLQPVAVIFLYHFNIILHFVSWLHTKWIIVLRRLLGLTLPQRPGLLPLLPAHLDMSTVRTRTSRETQ